MLILRTLFVSIYLVLSTNAVMAIEEPSYQVIKKFDTFELRQYENLIVAEVQVEGEFDEVGNEAFRILASYIFGKNQQQTKMAMTAPVNQVPLKAVDRTLLTVGDQGNSTYLVQFMMPSKFTFKELPVPNDKRVKLREIERRLVAARKYSGTWSQKRYERNKKILLDGMEKNQLKILSAPVFARYNSPFSLWFLRRNEVLVNTELNDGGM